MSRTALVLLVASVSLAWVACGGGDTPITTDTDVVTTDTAKDTLTDDLLDVMIDIEHLDVVLDRQEDDAGGKDVVVSDDGYVEKDTDDDGEQTDPGVDTRDAGDDVPDIGDFGDNDADDEGKDVTDVSPDFGDNGDLDTQETTDEGSDPGQDVVTDDGPSDIGQDTGDVSGCDDDEDCQGRFDLEPCEEAFCEDHECLVRTKANDAPCVGHDRCLENEYCMEGECIGGTAIDCGDEDPCTLDLCEPGDGCYHETYTGFCDDQNACTEDDSCATGSCLGTAVDCNDENDCTTESCDRENGCEFTNLDGTSCSDNDECTIDDLCVDGVCMGNNRCSDDNECTQDICSGLSCENVPLNGGTCNDGLDCTENDTCVDGGCAGTPIACSDDNACTTDSCVEGIGCTFTANNASCNDGNPCTKNDTCSNKTCAGTAYTCVAGDCMTGNTCDGSGGCIPSFRPNGTACATDADQCTDDICNGGTCTHPTKIDGSVCSDGDMCTQTDTCQQGVCEGDNRVVCAIVDPCAGAGACDPTTGECSLGGINEGDSCSDGNPCTTQDRCVSGVCTPRYNVVCPPISQCHTAGTCDPSDGTCSTPIKTNGTVCNDQDKCTIGETCQEGECIPGSEVECTALDQCHDIGTCNPSTGACSNPLKEAGAACDDGQDCTHSDSCSITGYCNGTTYSCYDAKSCTDDLCDGIGGCNHPVKTGWCLIEETCRVDGSVNPSTPCLICDFDRDADAWTNNDGQACSDSNQCTSGDICEGGACVGSAYSCNDNLWCTSDSCDGVGGCINLLVSPSCLIDGVCYNNNTSNPENTCMRCNGLVDSDSWSPRIEGDDCNDGDQCSHSDKCLSGTCTGTGYECADEHDCTADSCDGHGGCSFLIMSNKCLIDGECADGNQTNPDNTCQKCVPGTNQTAWTAQNEGGTCDDSDPCTINDYCSGGTCMGGPSPCNDGFECTEDSCDPADGCTNVLSEGWCLIDNVCYTLGETSLTNSCLMCIPESSDTEWYVTDGKGCDDGDVCTLDDVCVGETCQGTPKDCDDGLDCTEDLCAFGDCYQEPAEGFCWIGGACFDDDEIAPENVCLICDAETLPMRWSYNDGVTCSDSNMCTHTDTCARGNCSGSYYFCDDGLFCTDDSCDGTGACAETIQPDQCLIDGVCYSADFVSLSNACTACVPGTDQEGWTSLDGTTCNDNNSCTYNDTCMDSACSGTPNSCSDGLECTTDTCDGLGGCDYPIKGGWCLIDGACVADQEINAENVCLACISSYDAYGWSANNGRTCDDEDQCTLYDYCWNGACTGIEYSCDDNLVCTSDFCDGMGGCVHDLTNDYCLIDDECYTLNAENPLNRCQWCLPELSAEMWSNQNLVACNDGSSCTLEDICEDGECTGNAYDCADEIECTLDLCDGIGGCANPLSSDYCYINSVCYEAGTPKPGVACMACRPDTNQFDWTDLNPGAVEICNGVDDNCDGITDPEDAPGCVEYYPDEDSDGFGANGSASKCLCAAVYPYTATVTGDCNDDSLAVKPGARETCDLIDNNCDGLTDPVNTSGCTDFYMDKDGDGKGLSADYKCYCRATGDYRTVVPGDCNDNDEDIFYGNEEICDSKDNNCDGLTDPPSTVGCNGYLQDLDRDGFGNDLVTQCLCTPTSPMDATVGGDCDDGSPARNPGAEEECDGIDNDCSGMTDDGAIEDMCPVPEGIELNGTASCNNSCIMTCNGPAGSPLEPGWHDNDSDTQNGCECQGDDWELLSGGGTECMTAHYVGALMDDTGMEASVIANVSTPNGVDWFKVDAIDMDPMASADACDSFNFVVRFVDNPDDTFAFDIYRGNCLDGSGVCEESTTLTHSRNFRDETAGECECSPAADPECEAPANLAECLAVNGMDRCGECPGQAAPNKNLCTDNSAPYYVRVYRKPGKTSTCSNYTLEFSNGKYAYGEY